MTARTILYACLVITLVVLRQSQLCAGQEPQTITFPSADGIAITADLYMPHPKEAPLIVLFHQAGWSRGEYRNIAPRLNTLGYNCLAVDLRSGENVNRTDNETFRRARDAGKPTNYLDAYTDMKAAVDYARKSYKGGQLIVWGSSYSASLAIVFAAEHPGSVDGVVAFSPGEYFARFGKSATYVQEAAQKVSAPLFIASARKEYDAWKAVYDASPSARKAFFLPKTEGNHGSRALWSQFQDSEAYWFDLRTFLASYFPTAANHPKKR